MKATNEHDKQPRVIDAAEESEKVGITIGTWRCWAYLENGEMCGRPAVAIDAERGYTVCEIHQRKIGGAA